MRNNKQMKLILCDTRNVEEKKKNYSQLLNDQDMILRTRDIDFIAKEVHYHPCCLIQTKSTEVSVTSKTDKLQQGLSYRITNLTY